MSERFKDFEEAIDQMIHNYQSMVDSENRSKTELYAKNYVDYREFIVEAYKKALSRVEKLEKENKRLEDFIETIQNVHFVEVQREKAENRRYREVINNINEKAMLYGVNEQAFEAIKEAIRVLEGRE